MKKNSRNFLLSLTLITFLFLAFSSCKKDKSSNGPEVPPTPDGQLSDADSLKYLMYNIMQVSLLDGGRDSAYSLPSYFWYDKVPRLNPLDPTYDSAAVLLQKMKSFAINPATNKPFDVYSFLDHGEAYGEIQQGVAGDLGLQVTLVRASNDEIYFIVLYVEQNSPAALANVKRGDIISQVNGTKVTYDGSNGPLVKKVVKAVYEDDQATFTFVRPDKSTFTSTLYKAVYSVNPILFDTIYNVGGKKTGYFVFNSFANVTYNNAPTQTRQKLNAVFAKFESAGIKNLIVDFRYNGGGSTNTAQYLDSLMAPASAQGQLMYRYIYNDKLSAVANQIGLEDKIMFSKTGNLQLDNLFFIAGASTASASEIVINSLKPYMNVKVVGDTTYGKPVGFFGFGISIFKDKKEKHLADLYAINFEVRNALNQGEYYNGIAPDAIAIDYVDVPWGSLKDDNLASIFNYIEKGSFARISPAERIAKKQDVKIPIKPVLRARGFQGMVDYKNAEKLLNHLRGN